MSSKTIYSRRCWIENKLQPACIHIKDGIIDEVVLGERESDDPMADFVVMPGVIDAHVHINEPGRTSWEGFETATRASAAGGICTLVDMPLNSSPVTTSVKALEEKMQASAGKLSANVGFYGGVIPGNKNEILPLAEKGVLGFKCFLIHSGIDEFPNVTMQDLEEAMPLIAQAGLPLLAHCETDRIHPEINIADDPGNYSAYVKSRPGIWEQEAVEMMIALCRKHNCRVHIVHVSYAGCLDLIRQAKEEGLPITAETCPHYIYFNEEEIPDANTIFKCAPPIRDRANNDELKLALADGLLDFIASDHSPAPPDIKELESGNLRKAWGGIAGLQFLLSASWTALMNGMSLETFIPLLTSRPAGFLGLDKKKGYIRSGYGADFVIWDPAAAWKVNEEMVFHRHKQNPYTGNTLYGKVAATYVNGVLFSSSEPGSRAGQLIYNSSNE